MAELVPYDPRRPRLVEASPTFRDSGIPMAAEPTGESAGLREYFAIFRRHPWLILGMVLASTAFTFYRVGKAPPQYRATSTVKLSDTRRQVTGLSQGSPYDDMMGRETEVLASQIQVLMSRQLAGEAVDQAGLRLIPGLNQPYLSEIRNIVVGPSPSTATLRFTFGPDGYAVKGSGTAVVSRYGQPLQVDDVTLTVASQPRVSQTIYNVISRDGAIGTVLGGLRATPRAHTDIIDLDYTGSEPHYAQAVANVVALSFQLHSAQGAQQQSKRRRVFLEQQLQQTGALLQRAMNDYSSYRSHRQVFSSKEKASAQQTGLINVEMRRADLDAQKRTYQSLLLAAQRGGGEGGFRALMSAPGLSTNPAIQQLASRLSAYESARDSLASGGAASTNPDLVAINSLIASTTSKMVAAVRAQIQGLDAQIASLDNMTARTTAEISSAPATETEEAQLSQQVQNIQKIEDRLQDEYQNAKMTEAVEAGQVEIVDLATLPGGALAEGRSRKISLGVLIGIMLGFGAAILVDGMNTSIRRRDDLERVLQVPGLAVIPRFVPSASTMKKIAASLPSRASNGNGSRLRQKPTGLVTVHDARSSSAEAYRTLRTNLMFSQAVQTLRTVVITSPSPGEGKTTTAANLAVSFAQQGMRVLLVDCDLRRSKLHSLFGVTRSPGLTEILVGTESQETAIRETAVAGLYLLASGNLPPNPAELLGGPAMRKTLEALSEGYDLIVIDTPPLLAASDASILATITDGALLVVKAGSTEAEAGHQALQQLSAVGARVVGAVLNDPDAKVQKYGAYYRYEYASQS